MTVAEVELKKGLKGVYLDKTESSDVMGDIGRLIYRGYDIHDLAEKSTFEETTFLLLKGKLPTRRELAEFDSQLKASRPLPPEVVQTIKLIKDAHPMDVLRTAVSALAAFDPEVNDNSLEATLRKGIRLSSQAATIVAAHQRIREGKRPVTPSEELNHAGNFLYMLFGKKPGKDETRLMDVDFILHADHGANASAFAARVTASTMADLHAAIVTGIGTLKGPLHGGAAEEVTKMTDEIGDASHVEEYVKKVLGSGGRIMGFGHRVYKTLDPRAVHLRDGVRALGEKRGQPSWFQIISRLEEVMQPYASKGICPNVDLWSGAMYTLLGIPKDLFVPMFAIGRVPGWSVQVLEQYGDNVLIRPLLQYVGPKDLKYVPIEQRG